MLNLTKTSSVSTRGPFHFYKLIVSLQIPVQTGVPARWQGHRICPALPWDGSWLRDQGETNDTDDSSHCLSAVLRRNHQTPTFLVLVTEQHGQLSSLSVCCTISSHIQQSSSIHKTWAEEHQSRASVLQRC